jgi:16S rRNA (guanine1207-N2)-methyltransferase
VCYRLIEESYEHLNPQGALYVVSRHAKGGAMLRKKMEEIFGNVMTLVKQGGFHVYKSVR